MWLDTAPFPSSVRVKMWSDVRQHPKNLRTWRRGSLAWDNSSCTRRALYSQPVTAALSSGRMNSLTLNSCLTGLTRCTMRCCPPWQVSIKPSHISRRASPPRLRSSRIAGDSGDGERKTTARDESAWRSSWRNWSSVRVSCFSISRRERRMTVSGRIQKCLELDQGKWTLTCWMESSQSRMWDRWCIYSARATWHPVPWRWSHRRLKNWNVVSRPRLVTTQASQATVPWLPAGQRSPQPKWTPCYLLLRPSSHQQWLPLSILPCHSRRYQQSILIRN